MRLPALAAGLLLVVVTCSTLSAADTKPPAEQLLFNGKDTSGWKLRPDQPGRENKWSVVATVTPQKDTPTRLDTNAGEGVLVNGGDGKGNDLMTKALHGDCELHVEFLIAKGTNSGVYFHGQYELQIFDSSEVKEADLKYRDCGGVYKIAAPRKNASKAPGEWQSFDVVFRAPRFDESGKKTADARFVKVTHNGILIHEDVDVNGPNAGRSLGGDEKPKGPLMLQGTEAPVAFRNLKLKPLDGK